MVKDYVWHKQHLEIVHYAMYTISIENKLDANSNDFIIGGGVSMYVEKGMQLLAELVADSYVEHSNEYLEDECALLIESGALSAEDFVRTCRMICGRHMPQILLHAARVAACQARWYADQLLYEETKNEAYLNLQNAIDQYVALRSLALISQEYIPAIFRQCRLLAKRTRTYALEAYSKYKHYK